MAGKRIGEPKPKFKEYKAPYEPIDVLDEDGTTKINLLLLSEGINTKGEVYLLKDKTPAIAGIRIAYFECYYLAEKTNGEELPKIIFTTSCGRKTAVNSFLRRLSI